MRRSFNRKVVRIFSTSSILNTVTSSTERKLTTTKNHPKYEWFRSEQNE